MNNKIKGLYIHIPFCSSICSYCDFYKMIAKTTIKDKYIDYLIKELRSKKDYYQDLTSIYIGGGTPTSLSLDSLEKLLKEINSILDIKSIKEFTIEANPNDLTIDMCNLLDKYNINRVSIGLQSTIEEKLRILNRNHNFDSFKKAIDNLKISGITNINCDYIYGVYCDSLDSIEVELSEILSLPITHISCYSLILEEHTILYNKYLKGEFKLIDEDLESQMYYRIGEILKENGFKHYEISNFAKEGYESIHNKIYWENDHYIAIGANSSGYIDSLRYTNINNLNRYFEFVDSISNDFKFENNKYYSEYNLLNKDDIIDNFIMLGLRLIEGIDLSEVKHLDEERYLKLDETSKRLANLGLVNYIDGRLSIKEDKLYISNGIILELID